MVVKEDGTKWACQSCLKGHRVSGCTHTDRELILVPKKGRPVTQCQHCRQERKKRSAHVRCDCGEADKSHHPKEKCIHLREAEERGKVGNHDDHSLTEAAHLAAVAEEQGCCCHHGGTCSCALLKKETDEDNVAPHGPAVKPRLEKTTSDGAIPVFANGHHKPMHRKNHAAHECGMPYKMPMPRAHTEQHLTTAARRSVDNLALDYKVPFEPLMYSSQDAVPYNPERRKSKSEQHSPKIPATSASCNGLGDPKLTSIDFSNLTQTQTNSSMQSATSSGYFSPMSGVNDGGFDPWSAFPSSDSAGMPNNNPFGVWPTPNEGHCMGQPALTAASSGTQSEIDEIPPMEDLYGFPMPSIQEDADNAEMINLASNNSPQTNRRSLPPGFFGNVDFTLGPPTGDWLASLANFDTSADDKMQAEGYDDVWQMPNLAPTMTVPQRALGGSRPTSRSVGSAPSDDLIKQLFPDIDIDENDFGPTSSPRMNFTPLKPVGQPPTSNPSVPLDFESMDINANFTSQPWADGSMSMPNDTFTTSYDLNDDFSNPDFSTEWNQ